MRVIVEETSDDNKNKRRTVVECEADDCGIDEALDMILRGLLAYGYAPNDIGETLRRFGSPVTDNTDTEPASAEEPKKELGEI